MNKIDYFKKLSVKDTKNIVNKKNRFVANLKSLSSLILEKLFLFFYIISICIKKCFKLALLIYLFIKKVLQ